MRYLLGFCLLFYATLLAAQSTVSYTLATVPAPTPAAKTEVVMHRLVPALPGGGS